MIIDCQNTDVCLLILTAAEQQPLCSRVPPQRLLRLLQAQLERFCRREKQFGPRPAANENAIGKIQICRLSGKKFAVGQRDTCNRQTFHLPTASKKFADCKCAAGHRQILCGINGKFYICHRLFLLEHCTGIMHGVSAAG